MASEPTVELEEVQAAQADKAFRVIANGEYVGRVIKRSNGFEGRLRGVRGRGALVTEKPLRSKKAAVEAVVSAA